MNIPLMEYLDLKSQVIAFVAIHQDLGEVTVRRLAQRFRKPQGIIIDIAEDAGMNINVGFQVFGMGYADLPVGEWTLQILK